MTDNSDDLTSKLFGKEKYPDNIFKGPYRLEDKDMDYYYGSDRKAVYGKGDYKPFWDDCKRKGNFDPKDPPMGSKIAAFSDAEWFLLQMAWAARKYNLAILRGQIPGAKGTRKAGDDYGTAQGITNGIASGKRYKPGEIPGKIGEVLDLF